MHGRTYTDQQLTAALAAARSWRGVLHALGLKGTSAGSVRSVQRHAQRLELSTAHFTGQRRWTDTQLRETVSASSSWVAVAEALGLSPGGGATTSLRAHALRLGVPTDHLATERPSPESSVGPRPTTQNLRNAGSFIAAAWFTLCGARVAWPLEPCRYDLIAELDGVMQRVQVKSTVGVGGAAQVMVSNSRRHGHAVYGPDEIDSFFVIDAALNAYLIPYRTVAGLTRLKLSHYVHFKIVECGRLLSEVSSPEP